MSQNSNFHEETKPIISIGLIQGSGAGPVLCSILEEVLAFIDSTSGQGTHKILKDPYPYHSFATIADAIKKGGDSKQISANDTKKLLETCKRWNKKGVKIFYRASINAQALYSFRMQAKEIKEFCIQTRSGHKVMIIRDQVEGFYANTDYTITSKVIKFEGEYTKEHQEKVFDLAVRLAEKTLSEGYEIWTLYKFHLFGRILKEWYQELNSRVTVLQPDTGMVQFFNDYIFHRNGQKDLLMICSNEVGDLIFEMTVGALNLDPKLDLFTRNLLTANPFDGDALIYQNVHGSADDIIIENRLADLRPDSTLRIAADIAEKELGYIGMINCIDRALVKAQLNNVTRCKGIVNCVKNEIQQGFNDKLINLKPYSSIRNVLNQSN